jgi:hypothetical protein
MKEPSWMQVISNSTVCNWFFIFYVVYAVVLVLLVLSLLVALTTSAGRKYLTTPVVFSGTISMIVATTQFLFFYILCERSLKPE